MEDQELRVSGALKFPQAKSADIRLKYRSFTMPDATGWTVASWMDWLIREKVYLPIRPTQKGVCSRCWQPIGHDGESNSDNFCADCVSTHLAGLVPISYSWQQGLEAMIYGAKNAQRWLNAPLAALLWMALRHHLGCIQSEFGQIDFITVIPSHSSARNGWDHLRDLHANVASWPQPTWNLNLLEKQDPTSASTRRREVRSDIFAVNSHCDVRGRRVLLIDDTWTSGGTLNSAAATIRAADGLRPVAMTLGRQFRPGPENIGFQNSLSWGRNADIRSLCTVESPRQGRDRGSSCDAVALL